MKKTDVLVLAGGTLSDDLKQYSSGEDSRALLKIGDRYMLEYIVDALRGAPEIGRILVIGLEGPIKAAVGDRVDAILPSKDTMLDNIETGLEYFKDSRRLLVSSCDIPLVKPEMISRFLAACNKIKGDVYYPVIEKSINENKFPETKRTYFRLSEGVFTGGNMVVMDPEVLRKNWDMLRRAIASRKSVFKLLAIIGVGFIVRYLFNRVTIDYAEKKISGIIGMQGRVVQVTDPEIGVDVDKESDLLLARKILEKAGA